MGRVNPAQLDGVTLDAYGTLVSRHQEPLYRHARGMGLDHDTSLDLVQDATTREPVPPATIGALKTELMTRGLLPFIADNRIHVVPPCTVSDAEVKKALAIYEEAFAAVEAV